MKLIFTYKKTLVGQFVRHLLIYQCITISFFISIKIAKERNESKMKFFFIK